MSDDDALARKTLVRDMRQMMLNLSVEKAAVRIVEHIEAARAEERERCARIAARWSGDVSLSTAIRSGSPAPAAPVVWTDAQVSKAAQVYSWFLGGYFHLAGMRAALEAASKEE